MEIIINENSPIGGRGDRRYGAFFNGKIQSISSTTLQINDLGLLRGYGLFDYFRTYNGRPFQWDWYWERFVNSSKILRIPVPIQKEVAFKVVNELIELSGLEESAIRFVLTGGYSENSISSNNPNLLIISEEIHAVKPEEYQNGMKVIAYDYVRDLPELKSTDYKHLMILQSDIKNAGATDVLFMKDGEISELSRSNVFHFEGDKLITPNRNILKGITRRTVMELAKPHFEVIERPVKVNEFVNADEIFTTSSTKRVLGIVQIDDQPIGNGIVGKKTQFLMNLMDEFVRNW
jgi:branched-chain amino acid aminotransferase